MRCILFFCCLLVLSFSHGQQTSTHFQEKITRFINEQVPDLLKENKVPGMAIAVLENGAPIYIKGLGFADVANKVETTANTAYNIGSISKLFTAWGVMKLVENGNLSLDDPVEKYLKRWKLPHSEFAHEKVTIRALLSHTAGISVHGYPGFPPDATLPSLEASLNGENGPGRANEAVEVVLEPNTKFQYSGGGYSILQLVIEEVTGTSYALYMQQEVFQPLQMMNTSFIIDAAILKNSAKPYDENGKETYIERFTAKAAAGLHTNLNDLIRFAKASFENPKVLSKATVDIMRKPVPITKTKRQAYGLGYNTYFFGPLAISGHAGSNTGWEAGFMMDFKDKSGLIMLTNGSNGEKVAINILRTWAKWKLEATQKQ